MTLNGPVQQQEPAAARDMGLSVFVPPYERHAGVLLPVFAMRREGDLGIGDTTAIKEMIDLLADSRIRVLQILPVTETGVDPSPYNSISARALEASFLTLSPRQVPGLSQQVLDAHRGQLVAVVGNADEVNYGAVKFTKLQLFRSAFDSFHAGREGEFSDQYAAFGGFCRKDAHWLNEYTMFRSLMDKYYNGNSNWTEWRPEHATKEAAQGWLESLPSPVRENFELDRERLAYIQWIATRQWSDVKAYGQAAGVEILHDIPFCISRYSADAWGRPELFEMDWYGGAPAESMFKPDLFTERWGQNWGNPLYKWPAHEAEGYKWWQSRLERTLLGGSSFRLDHALGVFRQYAFPWAPSESDQFAALTWDEAKAKTGGRVPEFRPSDDENEVNRMRNRSQGIRFLKAMQNVLSSDGGGIVAEDLGTVPPYVVPALEALGIPGFSIPLYERAWGKPDFVPVQNMRTLAVATPGTHDHASIAEFYSKKVEAWTGSNGEEGWQEMQRLMDYLNMDRNNPPREFSPGVRKAILGKVLEAPSISVVVSLPDVFGMNISFNKPGTVSGANWSARMPFTAAEMAKGKCGEQMAEFSRMSAETGRAALPS